MKRKQFTEEQIIGILRMHAAGAKPADLCRQHGISETTLYNWLRVGTLRGYRMGALWRIARVDLDAFIAAGRNVPAQESPHVLP